MRRVILAMSGGLDSSVAAAILKRNGFEILGVFLKLADTSRFQEGEKRVKKITKALKIPLLIFDLKKEFRREIVDYFLKEYKLGRTPNPCVICNKKIKFRILLKKAREFKANFVATGHYALKRGVKSYKLLRAKDKEKDQSYFLWMLNQKQLKHILFPIGDYKKEEVRKMAKKFGLPASDIPESMEICFILTTINDFLKRHLKSKPGKIVDTEGKAIGKHEGLWFYTVGQRKGIGLAGGPYFVLDKDLRKNLLIVTKNEKDLYKKELACKSVNWISGKAPRLPLKAKAKIRYRHEPASATITQSLKSKVYSLKFYQPQRAITPGQSVVFYKGQEILGGGIIC